MHETNNLSQLVRNFNRHVIFTKEYVLSRALFKRVHTDY